MSDAFAAQILTSSAHALGSDAAQRMIDHDPSVCQRWGPRAFAQWSGALESRIQTLAASALAHDPGPFVSSLGWSRTAFAARRIDEQDLHLSIECLRESLAESLPERARPGVLAVVDAGLDSMRTSHTDPPCELNGSGAHAKRAASYLVALLEGRRRDAILQIVQAADVERIPIREIYLDILQPAQRELGRMWLANEIHVGEEHAATAATLQIMATLSTRVMAERGDRPARGRVLAASVDGNLHEIGIRMISDLFELDGWHAVYLGASIPCDDLARSVMDFEVDLVALSAGLATHLDSTQQAVEAIRAAAGDNAPPILVGGGGFDDAPDAWKRIGADAYARTPDEAVEIASRLCPAVGRGGPVPRRE